MPVLTPKIFSVTVTVTAAGALWCAACSFPDYTIVPVDPLSSICTDGLSSAAETGIDCGGGCPPCGMGEICRTYLDCVSQSCVDGICRMPTCDDDVKNASEADVDCGGQCAACPPGSDCKADADCEQGVCAGFCQPPTCSDAVKNGDETGVDCGGECEENRCKLGEGCAVDKNCESLHCADGACVAPGCTDGVFNGTESDLDCGGGDCGACQAGEHCGTNLDCVSQICEDGVCTAFSCDDGVPNGQESATDCGGPNCRGCGELEHCASGNDCASGVCLTDKCVPNAPTDEALPRDGWFAGASDTYPDHDPNQVLDSVGGRWTSGKAQYNGMAFEVDMGQQQTFFSIVLRCDEAIEDLPGRFHVYLGNDRNYTEPALPLQYGTETFTTIEFDTAQLARHIKIVLRESRSKWWSINEINVRK